MKRSLIAGLGSLVVLGGLGVGAMTMAQPAAAGPVVTVYKTPT